MSVTRPIEEIKHEFERATDLHDITKLTELLNELKALHTMEANAWYMYGKGVIQMSNSDSVKALEYFERAHTIFSDIDDRKGLAKATGNIGVVHYHTGNFLSALKQFQKGRDLFEEINDPKGVGTALLSIGLIQSKFGNFSSAMEHLSEARDIFIDENIKTNLTKALRSMGNLCMMHEKYDEALNFNMESYHLCKEIGNEIGMIESSLNICNCYIQLGKLEKADHIFSEIDKTKLSSSIIKLSIKLHKGILEAAKGNVDSAYETLNSGLETAEKENNIFAQMSCHKNLLPIAQTRKDFEGYVKHNEALSKLREETEGKEKQRLIAIQEKEREMEVERVGHERERAVLYSTLPKHVADRVVRGEKVTDHFDNASILFLDIAGFTKLSSTIPPAHVVHLLDAIFAACDKVCDRNGVTKVKTIGDSYMAAAGVSDIEVDHVNKIAKAATEILNELYLLQINMPLELGDKTRIEEIEEIKVRIGLHCGPVVAGIIGKERLQYDVWGDTVNMASRMESTGQPGKIQISEDFAKALDGEWKLKERYAEVKGKGKVRSYFLVV